MSKIMIIPKSENQIKALIDKVDAFLIGVNDMSVNTPITFELKKIKELVLYIKKYNKQVFINLNKNMHSNDLDLLTEILSELNNLNVDGIFFYDIAIVNLKQKLNHNYELVWAQEHLTNNYGTINYWLNLGINYTLLSSEITIEEINQIINNTKSNLIMPIFGYQSMFVSKRPLLFNYLNKFSIKTNIKHYYLEKEGKKYPIQNNHLGTTAYTANILNGIYEYSQMIIKPMYILCNSFDIEETKFEIVIDEIKTLNSKNGLDISKKIDDMFSNIDRGFLYKETVYKVKKDDSNKR